MATMIPNDVEEFQTEGERVFFRFLQSVAKPDSRYVAWYLPDIKDKELEFILILQHSLKRPSTGSIHLIGRRL
jgi:hypothetical protein